MKGRSRLVANLALALASCLLGLALVEAALRSFFPKYEHLAAALYVRDPILGMVREPGRRGSVAHPDTGERHPFHHNNFGSRQHRNFSAADLEASVNVGFFGDSFTENARMAVQFSFTEPLDHLLNANVGEGGRAEGSREGASFNVLNFGVRGYSTQQSLLRYETWELRGALDHVFYLYCHNDLWENQIDGVGRPGWAAPALLGRLHLSYLALDAASRLSTDLVTRGFDIAHLFEAGWWTLPDRTPLEAAEAVRQGAPDRHALFRQLLRRFKAAAEGDGASFHLVRLPDLPAGFSVGPIAAEEGVEIVNLQNCFAELDPAHQRTPWPRSPYRFRRDNHWNEAGNRLAAVCLHRFLASRLGLPPMSDHEVARVLNQYYAAFETPALGAPVDPTAAAIRAKYDALHGAAPADPPSLPPPRTPSQDKLVIRSHFDVYLHDGWLAYVREGCRPSDFRTRFFLHVVPRDLRDLSAPRLPSGFDNLDFGWSDRDFDRHTDRPFFHRTPVRTSFADLDGPSEAATCTIYRELPRYPIERIRTGQYVKQDEGIHRHLWAGEHRFPAGGPPSRSTP